MLSKIVYSKTVLKDCRLNFDNKVIDNHFFPSSMPLFPFYSLKSRNDATLVFESRFESGNLLAAFKIGLYTYELLLSNDTNTSGFNKWFFFQVNNMKKDNVYNLAIINNLRQNKQYSNGVKIFTYSQQKNEQCGIGWHHSGENVSLFQNEIYQFTNNKRVCFNTLSFSYYCEYDDDTVYFANCIPYTYTKLMGELKKIKESNVPFYQPEILCKSLGGNEVEYYKISSSNSNSNSTTNSTTINININSKEKEGIILFARQHPSETVGSWVMKGVTELLIGESNEAKYIRDNFEVLVVPMVNVDGVIAGNSRTSYSGCDLNRKWNQPKKQKHPEIYFIKEIIRQFSNKRKVMCLVDFHGHLSDFNSFFYCNYDEKDINKTRAFPYACARSSSAINFDQCVFSMMKYKQGAGRINLFTEYGIENACTLETSGFGFDKGKYAYQYINENILQEIGRDVCVGIVSYHYYKCKQLDIIIPLLSSSLKHRIQPVIEDLEEGKMNIEQEDFADKNNCNSEDEGINSNNNQTSTAANGEANNIRFNKEKDEGNNNTTICDPRVLSNEEKDESFFPKLKSLRLKRIKIQLTNTNMVPKTSTSSLNLNSILETKGTNNTIIKSKSNLNLPFKRYQVPLSSSLNKTLIIPFNQSTRTNPLSDKSRLRYKTTNINGKEKEFPGLPKQPQIIIPSLKHISSVPLQCKSRDRLNFATLSPHQENKFYSTSNAFTQTESIFFDSKFIYYIGSYKVLKSNNTKEKTELNRNRFSIMKSLTFKEDSEEESITYNTKNKSTQTRFKTNNANRWH